MHISNVRTWSRTAAAVALLATLSACGSAPPAPPVAPEIPQQWKLSWILRLEDQRILRFELPPPPPAPIVKGRAAPSPPPAPTSSPDLAVLVTDKDASIRRRAALAVGRVGLVDGIAIVTPLLADADPEVRQMAAFALGLIAVATDDGSGQANSAMKPAVAPLMGALGDADVRVRGRAAEALGQIGAREAADAIGKMAGEYARSPIVAALQPDDETWPAAPEADALRLGLTALVRLRSYDAVAAAVLDQNGRPVSTWWPVAFALQRVADNRAAPALRQLLSTRGRYTASFAARGLGAAKDAGSAKLLIDLLDPAKHPPEVVVSAIRALRELGATAAAPALLRIATNGEAHANLRLEAVTALGTLRAEEALPAIQDLVTDPWPSMRAAALTAAAAIDREGFLLILSGLDPDAQWTVRVATADILAALPADSAVPRLREMLADEDKRVIPSVLAALTRHKVPDIAALLQERLKDPDAAVREAAARHLRNLRSPTAAAALREAFKTAQADADPGVRLETMVSLAAYGADANDVLKAALEDKDWSVRLRAADFLRRGDPATDYASRIRPAPGAPSAPYEDPQVIAPVMSPHAFIETAKGTIEIELAVLDAPQTARNFMTLARKGYFNGLAIHRVVANFVVQDGDPRGDGGGGPGYTIRDELNDRAYLRGTVGMALSRRDDGGSQFFITHSPQPHLDGRYTAFGRVVNGMEVVDRIQQGDVIQRIRIWDGKSMQ
jgi:cyclophilin family peptidyl-prolyl cis-trans isomerase/HEAT repeat protein